MSRAEEGDKVLGEETAMVGLAALAAPDLVKVALEALEALGPVMLPLVTTRLYHLSLKTSRRVAFLVVDAP